MAPFSKQSSLTINRISGDSAPLYNVKATLVTCIGTDYVFLFGGFDEFDNLDSNVYLLNLKTGAWEIDDKHVGLYREGHLAVYIGDGNILVFGGIPHDEFPTEEASNTASGRFAKDSLMMVYNVFTRNWVGPPEFAILNAPSSRSRHACCLSPDGTKVYISGGLVNSTPLNDLFCYDLISGHWTGPIEFISRFDHFISEHNGKLYSFGGLNKDMNHVNHTLTWFDLRDHSIGELVLLRKPMRKIGLNHSNGAGDDGDGNCDEDDEIDEDDLIGVDNKRSFNSADCEHIYMDSMIDSEVKIDVSLPLWGSVTNGNMIYSISSFNIAEFRYTPLINLSTRVHLDDTKLFDWKHSFVTGTGELYLLGHPLNEGLGSSSRIGGGLDSTTDSRLEINPDVSNNSVNGLEDDATSNVVSDSSQLTYFLAISLSDLGVPTTAATNHLTQFNSPSSLGSLSRDFLNLLVNGDFSDFEILTLADSQAKDDYNQNPDSYHNLVDKIMALPKGEPSLGNEQLLKSMKVHKSVLLARWPHFQRLIDSGMSETITNVMFIPEPFLWVQGMIFYIYSDTINFEGNGLLSGSMISIYDYSGMLLLSNVYELPQLRSRILQKLYHLVDVLSHTTPRNNRGGMVFSETMINLILKVWENVLVSEEPAFLLCISSFIRDRWLIFLHSKAFQNLSKDLIIRLCQDCTGNKLTRNGSGRLNTLNMVYARADSNTPEPEVLRILNASPETPSGRTRLSHSNSPFLRHITGNSPIDPLEPRAIRTSASFPILRNFNEYRTP